MNESSGNVQIIIKTVNNEDIVMRSTKQYAEKGEEIKTTEYFLDLEQANSADQVQEESEFITIEEHDPHFVSVEVANTEGVVLNDKEVIIWDELCRICANTNEQFIPIFSGEGLEHDLQSKIHSYLPLKISESDTLPNRICYNCAATLLSWHDLYKNCRSAQQRLVELQNKLNLKEQFYSEATTEEENVENVLEVETSNNDEFELSLKEEEQEEDNDDNDDDYDNAKEVQDVPEDSNRSKRVLPGKSRNGRKLHRPVPVPAAKKFRPSNEKPETRSVIKTKKLESVKPTVKRVYANKMKKSPRKTESSIILKNKSFEIKLETIEKPKSHVPENDSNDSEDEVDDMKNEIDDDDEDISKNEMDSSDDFYIPNEENPPPAKVRRTRRGKKDPSIPEDLTCRECKKVFRHPYTYVAHVRLHTGEKPFTCHVCGRAFGQSGSLYYHLKHVHEGIKNHACDICGRCFAMRSAMRDHRRIHTGERPFCCETCGKTFSTKASLYTHSKLHTDEYPFTCSYCQRGFRWKQQMTSHLTVHTKEKNHSCDVCGKAFGVKNELTRHVRTHSREKPFVCTECGNKFGQKRYLMNHMRSRHKPKETENTTG